MQRCSNLTSVNWSLTALHTAAGNWPWMALVKGYVDPDSKQPLRPMGMSQPAHTQRNKDEKWDPEIPNNIKAGSES